jgi:hypothetical protein
MSVDDSTGGVLPESLGGGARTDSGAVAVAACAETGAF